MTRALDRDRPDALGIVGYARPESMAALDWARRHGRPAVLMSESQAIDHPRVWWKEAIKRRRVRRFSRGAGRRARGTATTWSSSGCRRTGSPWATTRSTTTPSPRRAEAARRDPDGRRGLPDRPYFLAVSRFVPEKNLVAAGPRPSPAIARGAPTAGPGTWSSAATGRRRPRSSAAVAASGFAGVDPPAGLPPGRGAGRAGTPTPRRSSTRA